MTELNSTGIQLDQNILLLITEHGPHSPYTETENETPQLLSESDVAAPVWRTVTPHLIKKRFFEHADLFSILQVSHEITLTASRIRHCSKSKARMLSD
ncbi:hypothetical protein BaRGS_00018028 [Batillaria attramentaria]|uniref:Uncharacterized protein n=1 Tax=Batillaria attramentaria TaxID=370345 RepID=A0ABD0KUC9_9CAEN